MTESKPSEREAHDEEEFFFKLKLTNTISFLVIRRFLDGRRTQIVFDCLELVRQSRLARDIETRCENEDADASSYAREEIFHTTTKYAKKETKSEFV